MRHPDLPTPKFKKGDTVFQYWIDSTTEKLACPDCLNTKTWKITLPSGEEHTVPCQRCENTWGHELPSTRITGWAPRVRKLTIGSVRINTNDAKPISYMCRETGVGSGSVYYEHEFYTSEKEAMHHAEIAIKLNKADRDKKPEVKEARKFSEYGFAQAIAKKIKVSV